MDSWARGAVPCRVVEEERERSVETDLTIRLVAITVF